MAAELQIDEADGVLVLSGEVDTHTAPQLARRLAEVDDAGSVIIDLAGVGFISSAGLSAMLATQRRLESSGGALSIKSPTPAVARMIELSGLSDLLKTS
jgi:anti-anti-sigma factor